jgi:hypothetical protein
VYSTPHIQSSTPQLIRAHPASTPKNTNPQVDHNNKPTSAFISFVASRFDSPAIPTHSHDFLVHSQSPTVNGTTSARPDWSWEAPRTLCSARNTNEAISKTAFKRTRMKIDVEMLTCSTVHNTHCSSFALSSTSHNNDDTDVLARTPRIRRRE